MVMKIENNKVDSAYILTAVTISVASRRNVIRFWIHNYILGTKSKGSDRWTNYI